MLVERVRLAMGHHPLGDERAAAADDAGHAVHRQVQVLEHHAAVDRHVIDALPGLMLDHVEEVLRPHVLDLAAELLEHLIDRHGADRHRRASMIAWRMRSMSLPVERSITVSEPKWTAVCSLSSSSSTLLVTAELPMLALILHLAATPIAIGSSPFADGRGWRG